MSAGFLRPRGEPLLRYGLTVAMVIAVFGLRKLLEPVTGTGAPFVLFFGVVLIASLAGGRGPGILATLLSTPIAAYEFVVRTGYPLSEAIFQAAVFVVECLLVVYIAWLTRRSDARTRELIELAPDAFLLADLEGRYVEVNQAACRMFGYNREELVGRPILDFILAEDAPRLAAERSAMLASKRSITSEWNVKRKDGTLLPVEVSANILSDGRWQAFVRDISERRRRDDERQVFVSLLENSCDFIGIADPDGTPIYVNPAGRQMVGLESDFPVEQTRILDYYPPEERRFAAEVIVKSTIERGHWSGETFFRHWRTGEAIAVSDEHFMIRDPNDGRILGMGTVTRDISDARRAREQLKTSEARFAGIISMSSDAIISTDEHQRITLFNAGAEQTFGYAATEIIGAPLDVLLPERLQALHRSHVASFAAGPVTARPMGERMATIVGRRKNGEEFPAEATISKLRINGSTILTVVLRDITRRKRVEKEQRFLSEAGSILASSLDYDTTLINVGQLAVHELADWCIIEIVDAEDRLKRAKVVCADPDDTTLAARLERVTVSRDRPHFARAVLEQRRPIIIERVTPHDIETFAQSPEHLQMLLAIEPTSVMGLPLMMRGQLHGVIVLISSTPSRRYRRDDIPFAEALADRAALAIENGQLYRAAVQATQFRDEVLGVVAHDLRNPLAVILMQSAALRRSGPETERRNADAIDAIHRSANRMKRLIQDLLDVTLIESRQLGLERASLPSRHLLQEAVDALRPLAAASTIDLRLEVPSVLPDVWGDHHRLLQVLENLIGNAIKFTPTGGHITVSASAGDRDVLIRVSDNGYGIAAADVPHVFDRFWQAKRAFAMVRGSDCRSHAALSRRTEGASRSTARSAAEVRSVLLCHGRTASLPRRTRDDSPTEGLPDSGTRRSRHRTPHEHFRGLGEQFQPPTGRQLSGVAVGAVTAASKRPGSTWYRPCPWCQYRRLQEDGHAY